MRNLKRTLSLVLAALMLMGMMVVGAGAASKDFTDASDIKNVEAVDVMVALGILEGGDKGDFQPNAILTREQAAKIICYMLLGTENAEKLVTSGAVFSDVAADRWSAPYIAYCVNMGILAGDGAGHFFPEGKLTGAAFAKMLLVALGYNANTEKYVGNSWTINVATDALSAGIMPDGLVMTNELSRQDAAQMAFQTLTATMVEYKTAGSSVILPDGTQIVTSGASASKVENSDKADKAYNSVADGFTQFCEKYFPKLKVVTDTKDASGRPANTWSYDGTIGSYVNDTPVVTITADVKDRDALTKLLKDAGNYTIASDDTNIESTVLQVSGATNGKTGTVADLHDGTWDGNGRTIELYDLNNDKTVDYAVVTIPTFAEVTVTTKDATKSTGAYTQYKVDGNSTAYKVFSTVVDADADKDTAVVTGTVADGDMVQAYVDMNKTMHIFAVKTVAGVLTSKTSDNVYTIDGTAYKLAVGASAPTISKDEQTFYVDSYGYILGVKDAAAEATKYAMVIDGSTYSVLENNKIVTKYDVMAVLSDGTVETFSVADKAAYDTVVGEDNANVGMVYTYTTNSKDITTFKAATSANVQKQNSISTNEATLTGGLYANRDTKFYVVDWTKDSDDKTVVAGTVTVYTGIANVPNYNGLIKTYAVDTDKTADGIADVVFIYDNVKATVADEYVYLKGTYTETVDGKAYDAIVKGEDTTITIADGVTQSGGSALAKGLYTSIKVTDSNYTATAAGAATVKKVQNVGGLLFTATTADGTATYAGKSIKDDVAVYVIDTTEGTATVKTGADLSKAMTGDIYVVTDDDAVVSVYVLNA